MFIVVPGDKMFATGVWFDEAEGDSSRWKKLEELLVLDANGGSLPLTYRRSLQLYTDSTDNKFSPIAYMKGQYFVKEKSGL